MYLRCDLSVRASRFLLGFFLMLSTAMGQEAGDPHLDEFNETAASNLMVMVPMRDGVKLATDVHLPKGKPGPFPVIFVKTPYNFNKLQGSSLEFALEAVKRGYAYVVQNERGRYYSQGEWELLGDPAGDGYDSLTWLAEQQWSSGAVGTYGCSSTAEWQLALAAKSHPAHKAMVPMAAGAGIGRVGEFYEQGNWYKGGVHQTLFTVWLYGVQQDLRPQFPQDLPQEQLQRLRKMYDLAPDMPSVNWKAQLRKLPAVDWLRNAGANEGPGARLMALKPNDPQWYQGGLYHDDQGWGVPAYWFNSWFDVSQGPNLALFNHARKNGATAAVRDGQYVLVAPTLHCGFFRIPEHRDLIVGELNAGRAHFDVYSEIFGFFDHYLKGEANGFPEKTPRVRYYTMGRNAWATSESWPPGNAALKTFYLGSDSSAASVFGDGKLTATPPAGARSDTYTYDPMNPVPSLGGGVCCNAGASLGVAMTSAKLKRARTSWSTRPRKCRRTPK